MSTTVYGPGGYDPTQPNNNVTGVWDDAARTFTDYTVTPAATRPYTTAENAAADAVAAAAVAPANAAALQGKARAAQAANATYLALTSPTAAQTTAQVQRITREVNALIKLAVADLADTSGT